MEAEVAPSLMSLNSQKIGSKFTLERVPEPDDRPPSPGARHLWGKARYLVLAMSVLCFTAARSNDMTFSFSVICMTRNSSINEEEGGLQSPAPSIPFTPRDLSLSFAGAGTGAILASVPLALLLQRFGGRMVMGVLLLLSSLATFALPFAAIKASREEWPISSTVFPLRILQGLSVAAVMPMLGFVSAHWAPVSEMGNFITLLSGSAQISQIFTMPVSGYMCVSSGWPSTYYFHGVLSVIFALLFMFFFTNSPKKHFLVSEVEINTITDGVHHKKRKEQRIPYRAIVSSKAIWAVWIGFLGNAFGFQLILQFMPIYLNKVLGVPISRTGISAMLPPLAQLVVKIIVGILSDKITCISERRKLQMFNSIAMCGCALFLFPLGFLHHSEATVAIACICTAIACLGLISCGSMKSATMVARQYSHFVMSVVQFVICIAMLAVPFLVSTLAPNNKIEEWRSVFMVVCAILLISNLIFCLLCDSEPAPWTVEKYLSTKKLPLLSDDPQATVATIAENI